MGDGQPAAEVLSAELAALRARAGNPSFRKMADRSGQISHTTLHEAVRGTRFPSWDTTREFVRACDADEQQWRRRWEELKGVPPEPAVPVGDTAEAAVVKTPAEPVLISAEPAVAEKPRHRRRYALAAVAFVVVLVAAVGAIVVPKLKSGSLVDVGARVPGDNSQFVDDVTVPDGAVLHVGETVQKVWELRNTGSVAWHQRYLQRMDLPPSPGTCRTPDRVLIGDTPPGDHVMVSVPLTASPAPGRCWIGWKMVDAKGAELFSTRRPVYVLVTVVS
ncbi:helix-turn-helix domain-containing protein [Amycolatopsis rubida]|uniref:Helix-turn-helix domain-containing protein n=2 Tax=Amycolatopsis TaxID=1813 RepID=A0ABX0CBW9_9PSEU|nr:NBR1-Ig-like domain-containing protein [Amycolatopsis rubida]MYW97473.1 helix-turn-helix domain-containing protein [Amycolatopsis rubida]NEC62458.1 helix-turn-helix domain-containing protein [Amycolatopsis rubida]